MIPPVSGIHHITAVSGPPQNNYDFYAGILGLRLIKRTVNFDDPYTWHLYYGNYEGTPGSSITFFPWMNAVRGQPGSGETGTVGFVAPEGSLSWWGERLQGAPSFQGPEQRFGMKFARFADVDGLPLELFEDPRAEAVPTRGWGGVPEAHAIRGFAGAVLFLSDTGRTAELFEEFGWILQGREDGRTRYTAPGEAKLGSWIDLAESESPPAKIGAGSVHHIAFRTPDEESQLQWHARLTELGFSVSPVRDRQYFRSIYFREPGGVLFEIATDGPGFAADEAIGNLGEKIALPSWFERHREQIEQRLPDLVINS